MDTDFHSPACGKIASFQCVQLQRHHSGIQAKWCTIAGILQSSLKHYVKNSEYHACQWKLWLLLFCGKELKTKLLSNISVRPPSTPPLCLRRSNYLKSPLHEGSVGKRGDCYVSCGTALPPRRRKNDELGADESEENGSDPAAWSKISIRQKLTEKKLESLQLAVVDDHPCSQSLHGEKNCCWSSSWCARIMILRRGFLLLAIRNTPSWLLGLFSIRRNLVSISLFVFYCSILHLLVFYS